MKMVSGCLLALLGFLLGTYVQISYAESPNKASCDDTKLSRLYVLLKSDPYSITQLKKAVAGDADAALSLAVMMGKVDAESMICLERMAAENGSAVSQENYGKFLQRQSSELARERGKYWLDRSKRTKQL